MTDRVRFENNATNCGAKVITSEKNLLIVISSNGAIKTTYHFNDEGSFVNYATEFLS